ncbi:hypothetical protein QBC44DRAFT_391649 [Cladorrhinum sp. PSN332]|nr:hypothetical protein QBC44DRAFT_391649 [Cladorrhinum sp. PSN332]
MTTAESRRRITGLPFELIRHICSFLQPTCVPGQPYYPCRECSRARPGCFEWYQGQIDVSRLSRTCKRLRDIIQPLVFLCFSDNGKHQVRRLVRLARTLIERPDLAQHMRFLMLGDPLGIRQLDELDNQFIQDTITQQIRLPPLPDHWNTDGDPQYRLIPLEIALVHTQNLQYLRIPLDYDWQLNLLSQLLPTSRFSLPALHSLEVFHFFIAGDCFSISLDAVETIIAAAPNLQALSLPSPNADSSSSTLPPLSNLRQLDLQQDCSISPELLSQLLSSAPKLEAFALHWDAAGDGDDYCVADAWQALARRAYALKEIWLHVRDDAEVDDLLVGLLPPSVRQVTFWNLCGCGMREAMLRFARAVGERPEGRYPKLESVFLARGEGSDYDGLDEWHTAGDWEAVKSELVEEFAKGGVRFEVEWDSLGWDISSQWTGLLF